MRAVYGRVLHGTSMSLPLPSWSSITQCCVYSTGTPVPAIPVCSGILPVTERHDVESGAVIAKFHYTGPTGPARTRTDFFAARVSEKLRWVRAGVRQSPCGSGRVRVVEFSIK